MCACYLDPEKWDKPGTRVTDRPKYFVGVAASAGGLEAVSALVQNLPQDANAVYVLAQHMSPNHKSLLTSLIARETKLPVVELGDEDIVPQPNTFYMTPPNHDVSLENGKLGLRSPSKHAAPPKPSADRLFKSIAAECGEYCVGIVLSGTGSDGSYGVQAMREAGGITIAQDSASAKYDGMPSSAVETGCIDLTLTPTQMGQHLEKILTSSRNFDALRALNETPGRMNDLMHILLARTRVDFRDYKENTVNRRVARRMVALGIEDYDDYVAHCRVSTQEVDALFRDLLISVTRFFRDNDQYEVLKAQVAELVERKGKDTIRVWVAGCATGEEVYSLAILLGEAMGGVEHLDKSRIQIFATDIDARALDVARAGRYPIAAAQGIPEQYLEKYFDQSSGKLRVSRALRSVTLFSHHNVFQDPPFMNVDLVSLRNVLIYFNSMLQERVLTRVHYALSPGGVLFLGTSETVGNLQSQFRPVRGSDKIFTKRTTFRRDLSNRLALSDIRSTGSMQRRRAREEEPSTEQTASAQMYDALLKSLAENGFVATRSQAILRVMGDISPYLTLSDKSRLTLSTELLKQPLRDDAMSLISLTLKNKTRRKGQWHPMKFGDTDEVRIVVYPLGSISTGDEHALVAIETRTSAKPAEKLDDLSESERLEYLRHIESEMLTTRDALQQTIEELQTSNEELQSVNEELQSTNEELQATNEELETSNEELQSTNEELITVNEEMKVSSTEMRMLGSELTAILESSPYPMLVLDEALLIRRASVAALKFFGLPDITPAGHHLAQVATPAGFPSLVERASEVFRTRKETVVPVEMGTRELHVFLTPFVDGHEDIIGLTLSVQEVDLSSIAKMTALMDDLGGISNWRYNLLTQKFVWSDEMFRIHGLDPGVPEPTVDQAIAFYHPDDRERVRMSLDRSIEVGSEFVFDARLIRNDGTEVPVKSVGAAVLDKAGRVAAIVGALKVLDSPDNG